MAAVKRKLKLQTRVKKALTPAKWTKKIDAVVSKLVNIAWKGLCALCGKAGSQTHHFFTKGAHAGTRFEPDACAWMCYGCHIFRVHRAGETEELRDKIIAKVGEQRFGELKRKAYEVTQYRIPEYKQIFEELSERLRLAKDALRDNSLHRS